MVLSTIVEGLQKVNPPQLCSLVVELVRHHIQGTFRETNHLRYHIQRRSCQTFVMDIQNCSRRNSLLKSHLNEILFHLLIKSERECFLSGFRIPATISGNNVVLSALSFRRNCLHCATVLHPGSPVYNRFNRLRDSSEAKNPDHDKHKKDES